MEEGTLLVTTSNEFYDLVREQSENDPEWDRLNALSDRGTMSRQPSIIESDEHDEEEDDSEPVLRVMLTEEQCAMHVEGNPTSEEIVSMVRHFSEVIEHYYDTDDDDDL